MAASTTSHCDESPHWPGAITSDSGRCPLLSRQASLGRPPATGPAQRMMSRFGLDPTMRLGLQIPLFRAPAACWCARTMMKSTLTPQMITPATSARARN